MPDLPIRLALALLALLPDPGLARPADLCDRAAERAARGSGVPPAVLLALTRTETGRDGQPWPWAVNQGGKGHWFDTRAAAEAYVAEQLALGIENLDIGCFQLNYRWHGGAFPSLQAMFDPDGNAAYAAEYLAAHHARTGDWVAAAGAYHSATAVHAEKYKRRFAAVLDGLAPLRLAALDAAGPGPVARVNRYPLLAGGQGQGGSLVPRGSGGGALIGGARP